MDLIPNDWPHAWGIIPGLVLLIPVLLMLARQKREER